MSHEQDKKETTPIELAKALTDYAVELAKGDAKADKTSLQAALAGLKPGALAYEAARELALKTVSERVYAALRGAVLSNILPAEALPSNEPARARAGWRKLFQEDDMAPLRARAPRLANHTGVAKVTIDLPTFDGTRGHALTWWTEASTLLNRLMPTEDAARRESWIPLLQNSMETKAIKNQFWAIHETLVTDDGKVSVNAVMDRFVSTYDQHALDTVLTCFRELRQGNDESIIDFRNRFDRQVHALKGQDHDISKTNQWHWFRTKALHSSRLRERPAIDSIAKAVSFLQLRETSEHRSGGDGSLNFTGNCYKCGRGGHMARDCKPADRPWNEQARGRRNKPRKKSPELCRKHIAGKCTWGDNCRYSHEAKSGASPATTTGTTKKVLRAMVARLNAIEARSNPGAEHEPVVDSDDPAGLEDLIGLLNDVQHHSKGPNPRKMAATAVGLGHDPFHTINALWDSGSLPHSYISLKAVQRLGLSKDVISDKKLHGNASAGSTFRSIGHLDTNLRLGGRHGATVPVRLLVAPLGMDMILGQAILEKVGGVIDFMQHQVQCCRLHCAGTRKHVKMPMIQASDWAAKLNATAADLWRAAPITLAPAEYRKKFPGLNLRQIAEELEKTKPADDVSPEQGRARIKQLLDTKYAELLHPIAPGHSNLRPVRLPVKKGHEESIVNVPMRTRPDADWEKIEEQVKHWLAQGTVVKSDSPFNAPHVLAKKDSAPGYRLATDFRRLNRLFDLMGFPVRRIEFLTQELSLKRWKTTLDLAESYLQIPVHVEDQHMLAFSTRNGKYQYTVVPYGICISAELFSQQKSEVISSDGAGTLLWHFLWYYIDDDSIGTDTITCHIFVLEVVFERFLAAGFRLRLPKCVFLQQSVKFLGKLVGHRTIANDPSKGAIIEALPLTPSTFKELRSFLGMASWHLRDFAPSYVGHAATITHKFRGLPKKFKFESFWDAEAQTAYDSIKALCKDQLVLASFDRDAKDTLVFSDWSQLGIAAVVTQHGKVVLVKGRSCQAAEAKYTPTKGELLAFTEAQCWFRVHLLSLQHGFTSVVDHRPLLGIIAKLDLEIPELLNMRLKTEEFRTRREVAYVMGDRMLADFWNRIWPKRALTQPDPARRRAHLDTTGDLHACNNINNAAARERAADIQLDEYTTEERTDLSRRERKHGLKVRKSDTGLQVLTNGAWRMFVPTNRRSALVESMHLPDHAGHVELMKRLALHYWPGKRDFVLEHLTGCHCSPEKSDANPRHEKKSADKRHITADRYLDLVQVDVYSYEDINYLTFIDVATGRAWVKKLLKKGSAKKIPGKHLNKVLLEYILWESSPPSHPHRDPL